MLNEDTSPDFDSVLEYSNTDQFFFRTLKIVDMKPTVYAGLSPYKFRARNLPPGLKIHAVTGVISGTPLGIVNRAAEIRVTDVAGNYEEILIEFNVRGEPGSLSKVHCWINPDDATVADGADILSITDRQGNLNLSGSAGETMQLSAGSNHFHGHNMMDNFDETNRVSVPGDATMDTGDGVYDFFIVCQPTLNNGNYWVVNKDNTNPATAGFRLNGISTGNQRYTMSFRTAGDPSTNEFTSGTSMFELGVPTVFRQNFDGTHQRMWKNGGLEAENETGDARDVTNSGIWSIGGHPDSLTSGQRGLYGDWVLCSSPLTDDEAQQVTDYLTQKFRTRASEAYEPMFVGETLRGCDITVGPDNNYHMLRIRMDGTVRHAIAEADSPLDWVGKGTDLSFLPTAVRGTSLLWDFAAEEWKLYYDIQGASTGEIYLASGPALDSLTVQNSGNPVIEGSGTADETNEFVRHPAIIQLDDGTFVGILDGRATEGFSGTGALYRATSTDGVTWPAAGSWSLVIDQVEGTYHESDVGLPHVVKLDSGRWVMCLDGFNEEIRGADKTGDHAQHSSAIWYSDDEGANWTEATSPVLLRGALGTDHAMLSGAPALQHVSDDELYVYYVAEDQAPGGDRKMFYRKVEVPTS